MPIKVAILDDYQGRVPFLDAVRELGDLDVRLEVITKPLDDTAMVTRLAECEALILIRERTRITRALLERLPRLKLVVQTGRLSGAIDLAACDELGIGVRDGSGSPVAAAELTWLLILSASRRLHHYLHQQSQGHWQRSADRLEEEALGRVVAGRTLGIWGLGRIGCRVAGYAQAFGMQVLVHGRDGSAAQARTLGMEYVADRGVFLARSDILSLHLKLNDETRHIVGSSDLAAMRPDALLVNTSRAELIAPQALLTALDAGRPGGAALDVFENEPEGASAYQAHARVLATPHLGFVERDSYENFFATAFQQLREFFTAGE